MRALIASIVSLALLIGIWGVFYYNSHQTLQHFISTCEGEILPSVEEENWDNAYHLFAAQYQQWLDYEEKARYMLETETLNDINEGYAKSLMYIKAEDLSNSSGELLALKNALQSLLKNETIHLSNIF